MKKFFNQLRQKEARALWKNLLGQGSFGKRLIVAAIFFSALTLFLHFREVRMEFLEQSTLADRYVIAQVDFAFPDEEATQIIKQQAVRDIGTVYRLSEKQIRQIRFDFESYLLTHHEWRDQLESTTFDQMYRGADALEAALEEVRFTNARTLQKMRDYHFFVDNYYLLPSASDKQALTLPKEFWDNLQKKVFVFDKFPQETSAFIVKSFENQLWALQEDHSTQRNLRQIIQQKVADQYTQVRAGARLIEPGERVTGRHLAMMQSMKEAMRKERNHLAPRTILGSALLSLIFTVLSICYLYAYHRSVLDSLQKMILLVTLFIFTLCLAKLAEYLLVTKTTYFIDIFRYPILVPFAAILIFFLVENKVSLFAAAFLTIVLGTTLAIQQQRFLIINLIASWVSILFARQLHKRKEVFSVLAKVWLCCVPVIFAFNLAQNIFRPTQLFQDLFSSLLFMGITALLVVGLLPILESTFKLLTNMTLMEFMDPNNELLRRLSVEAPGTYQHSLVVGNLSESAAHAIQANGLFCRVATLYHDIGKLFNPHYFTENQLSGFNMHQLLTPLESAQVIISHVVEGAALARKHKLPQSFIDIICEHHGTTMVYFFYHKQLEIANKEAAPIDQKLFRYPGPKPHTKESAIIMLADTIEAASRSLDEMNEERLEALVNKLVAEKADDGQLDECQLTFEELGVVKKTMIQTLILTGHLRVKYPERKKEKSLAYSN